MIPEPSCVFASRLMRAIFSRSFSVCTTSIVRFGRSKPLTNVSGLLRPSCSMMSERT